jgi:hypothetical protein
VVVHLSSATIFEGCENLAFEAEKMSKRNGEEVRVFNLPCREWRISPTRIVQHHAKEEHK